MGAQLHSALQQHSAAHNVRVHGIECLAACKQASTLLMSQPNKWGYMLANLTPADAGALLDYTAAYAADAKGAPPFNSRPELVRRNTIARTPPAMRTVEELV